MMFEWLDDFQREQKKPANYAEKSLAAYRLGMKARGAIVGVRIERNERACAAILRHGAEEIYHPEEAPHVPLPDCHNPEQCGCVYRPVMRYEIEEDQESS